MRPFDRVSASQVDNFLSCQRKWYIESILGIRPPQKPSAALGEAVHAANEAYVVSGKKPDPATEAGRIALAGLHLLPPPGSVFSELEIAKSHVKNFTLAGISVLGFIDQLDIRDNPPTVTDYKTTSNLKYALDEQALTTNPQIIIYSQFTREYLKSMGMPDPEIVRAGHIVYLTRGKPVVKQTLVDLSQKQIDATWQQLAGVVTEMKSVSGLPAPGKVRTNRSACDKYGGCPHRERCGVLGYNDRVLLPSLPSFPVSSKENSPMSETNGTPPTKVDPFAALARLKAQRAAQQAQEAAQPPAPPVPPAETPVAVPGATSAAQAPAETPRPSESLMAKYRLQVPSAAPARPPVVDPGVSILPPDAPPSEMNSVFGKKTEPAPSPAPAPEAVTPEPGEKGHVRRPKGYATKLTSLGWTGDDIDRMTPDTMRAIIDGQLDGRACSLLANGQVSLPAGPSVAAQASPGPLPEPTREEPTQSVVVPGEVPSAEVTPTPAPVEDARPLDEKLVLYIDCWPVKGPGAAGHRRLEDILAPYMKEAADAGNNGDGKYPLPIYSLVEYGKGPARVAALLLRDLPRGVVVANTRYPATDAALEVLVPLADEVIRGVR